MTDFLSLRSATLIIGPQGSGKTLLAQALAAGVGRPFMFITAEDVGNLCQMAQFVDEGIRTFIVDEHQLSLRTTALIKAWISSPMIAINRKHLSAAQRAAPNLIVCTTGHDNALELDSCDRRFQVIRLGAEPAPAVHVDQCDFTAITPAAQLPPGTTMKLSSRMSDGSMQVLEIQTAPVAESSSASTPRIDHRLLEALATIDEHPEATAAELIDEDVSLSELRMLLHYDLISCWRKPFPEGRRSVYVITPKGGDLLIDRA